MGEVCLAKMYLTEPVKAIVVTDSGFEFFRNHSRGPKEFAGGDHRCDHSLENIVQLHFRAALVAATSPSARAFRDG